MSVERTKHDHVSRRAEGQVEHRLATVYRCIVAKVDTAGQTYQLAEGSWHAVAVDFVARVRSDIAAIPFSPLEFPEVGPDEDEGDYNRRVATHLP